VFHDFYQAVPEWVLIEQLVQITASDWGLDLSLAQLIGVIAILLAESSLSLVNCALLKLAWQDSHQGFQWFRSFADQCHHDAMGVHRC
jgi:hypothetical protein